MERLDRVVIRVMLGLLEHQERQDSPGSQVKQVSLDNEDNPVLQGNKVRIPVLIPWEYLGVVFHSSTPEMNPFLVLDPKKFINITL